MFTWGFITCSVQSINSLTHYSECPDHPQLYQAVRKLVIMRPFVSPCSGCCYHSAVSGGSCSACSSASSPCGNRRSWGPSGYQGNGPAEACSETSSQMDWRGRQTRETTLLLSSLTGRKKVKKKDTQTETSQTEMKVTGHISKTHTHTRQTDNYKQGPQHATSQKQSTFK